MIFSLLPSGIYPGSNSFSFKTNSSLALTNISSKLLENTI